MAPEIERQRGRNQALNDALSMEEHGLVLLGHPNEERLQLRSPSTTEGALAYRQVALLVLISSRLKEITERLMEVEKVLKERDR